MGGQSALAVEILLMKKKVLIVDDSRFVFEEMREMLRDTDFEPSGYCVRGEDVVSAYERTHPDVVSMDIILPGMDGFEASENLLEAFPEAKIVVVSSLAYDETEKRAMELGAKAFVFKPFSREMILTALRYAIGEDPDGLPLTPPQPDS